MKRSPEIFSVRHALALAMSFIWITFFNPARADEVVADLSEHLIEIRSNFTGTSLLLFGAINWSKVEYKRPKTGADPAFDVIVTVSGPAGDFVVRKKERIAGIWINRQSAATSDSPTFYAIMSTRPVADVLTPDVLEKQVFRLNQIPFNWKEEMSAEKTAAYKDSLLRNMQEQALYAERYNTIKILGDTLFQTRVYFPVTVPVGTYRADIYLVRDGRILASQVAPLNIGKEGLERTIWDFAHNSPAIYGLTAILIALAAGLIAGEVSRRIG